MSGPAKVTAPLVHARRTAVAGAVVFVAWLLLVRPAPLTGEWPQALLLLAALVVVPLALGLARTAFAPAKTSERLLGAAARASLPAALSLALAVHRGPGDTGAILATPWLVVTALAAVGGLLRAIARDADGATRVSGIALLYLGGAGAATLVVSSGAQPLGYDLFVILLTAVHYHYAGLALVLSTALCARRLGDGTARAAAFFVAAGVPLVATGIAVSKAGGAGAVEGVSAVVMALSGLLAAAVHGRLALARELPGLARVAFGLAAFGLAIGMPLAALYGLRIFGSTAFLDLTTMGAVHGTANALGVGVAALVGWSRVTRG